MTQELKNLISMWLMFALIFLLTVRCIDLYEERVVLESKLESAREFCKDEENMFQFCRDIK